MLTTEQLKSAREIRRRYNVIREYRSRLSPTRLFIYVDDGVSQTTIDSITHEIAIHPDGRVYGEPEQDLQ
jgi:hypothetical protein